MRPALEDEWDLDPWDDDPDGIDLGSVSNGPPGGESGDRGGDRPWIAVRWGAGGRRLIPGFAKVI